MQITISKVLVADGTVRPTFLSRNKWTQEDIVPLLRVMESNVNHSIFLQA